MTFHFTTSSLLFGILALITLGSSSAAGPDCNKRPPKVGPLSCCLLPEILTDEIVEKCKMAMPLLAPPTTMPQGSQMPSEVPDKSKPHPPGAMPHGHHHHGNHGSFGASTHSCFLTCVFNETGILVPGPETKLNEVKLHEYLKVALVNATDLIPSMESSFKTCAAKGEEFRLKFKEKMEKKNSADSSTSSMTQDRMMRPPHHHQCSPAAGHLMHCVFKETFLNCPATIWSNTKECNDLRDFMKNCKPKFNDKNDMPSMENEM